MRVAIVDDEADIADIYAMFLQNEFDCTTITKDFESWKDPQRWKDSRFDLAIIDYLIPSLTCGCQLAEAAAIAGVKVVICTAVPGLANNDAQCKGFRVIPKPITKNELIAVAKNV